MEMADTLSGFFDMVARQVDRATQQLDLLDVLADSFHRAIEELSQAKKLLTTWEDEYLLDNPTPEALAAHKVALEKLISVAELASKATALNPTFLRPETCEMLEAVKWVLKEKLLTWHNPNPMTREQADKLLKEVFPES